MVSPERICRVFDGTEVRASHFPTGSVKITIQSGPMAMTAHLNAAQIAVLFGQPEASQDQAA